jgi:twinkle protein
MEAVERQDWADVGIRIRGNATKVACPQCSQTSRHKNRTDLSIDLRKGFYNCHNNGCEFRGRLRGWGGAGDADWRFNAKQYVPPVVPAGRTLGPRAQKFLRDRSIDPTIAEERYKLWSTYRDGRESGIAIPYLRGDEIVHIKYRAIDEKKFYSSNDTEPIFYNLNGAEGAETVYLCEGEFEVLALATAGIHTGMSVPNGAPGANKDGTVQDAGKKLDCMASGETILKNARKIVLAMDADKPGQVLRDEFVRRLGKTKTHIIDWPDGCKDGNDTLKEFGVDLYREIVEDATPVPVDGITYALDVFESVWEQRATSTYQGREVRRWRGFNSLFRMGEGQLTIVTGVPQSGKSHWMRAYMVNLSEVHDFRVAMFPPEDGTPTTFVSKLMRMKIPFFHEMPEERKGSAFETATWLHDHIVHINPKARTVAQILELATVLIFRHGIKALVIDPWTEVRYMDSDRIPDHIQIANALSDLQAFAQDFGIAIFVVAHPTKEGGRDTGPIGMYDVRGTATWADKADRFISIYRDIETGSNNTVEIHVLKTREESFGRNGQISMSMDPTTKNYVEIERSVVYK